MTKGLKAVILLYVLIILMFIYSGFRIALSSNKSRMDFRIQMEKSDAEFKRNTAEIQAELDRYKKEPEEESNE